MGTTQDHDHREASEKKSRDCFVRWYGYEALNPGTPVPFTALTLAQAKLKVNGHVQSIFESWRKLNRIISTREAVIRRRWIKKTHEQRKKILLAGWPGMPSMHRPDFYEMLRRYASRGDSTKFWDSALGHPAINMEDLLQAKSLLLLLNSRGRHLPDVFAHADLESCRMELIANAIRLPLLPRGFAMLLAGQETEEKYGMIQPENGKSGSSYFCECRGFLVLQTQEKLLKFLLECCYRILHDIPHDALINPNVPVQAEPEAITVTETSYFQLSAVVVESLYRAPKELDTMRLLKLIEARKAQATDHVWDMREDPGYFASTVIDYANFQPHPNQEESAHSHDLVTWSDIVSRTVFCTYVDWAAWTDLDAKAAILDDRASTDFRHLDHTKPLPKNLEDALLDVANAAESIVVEQARRLESAYSRSGQDFLSIQDVSGAFGHGHVDTSPGDLFKLTFSLLCSTGNCDFLAMVGGWSFIDVIQHMLDQKPSLKKKVSAYILGIFSDLSLSLQILKEILDFFPWSASFPDKLKTRKHRWMTCCASYTLWWTDMYNCLKSSQTSTGLPRLVLPLTTTFYYPTDKPYNQANVDALRRAERHLDDLWESIDGACDDVEQTLHGCFRNVMRGTREIKRTGPWIPPASSLPEPQSQPSCGNESCSSDITVTQEKLTHLTVSETPRTKVKTRGTPDTLRSHDQNEPVIPKAEVSAPAPATYHVSERALKVFNNMFHVESTETKQREIAWTDFLHAMTAVGFSAEKLYGSVWHFAPGGLEGGSIHIHEPHPSSKIPFRIARRIGRRLSRQYGWTGETFTSG
ncbi:hypothetical protein EDD37DRAFT_102500 [Exophiala viscosa]|uniref:Clr5 domain-containing protein n=1 Tax=Exophiala viscosa TaxID=2486360 RepID=A0AAN6E0K6_9EURO|nr:hypothetical protein EDD36DRAFT_121991 [Exophiala viscosa]KAI1630377.1 hypothetical protein EDD37DRAFT_102500 [Exophiala viscosa]